MRESFYAVIPAGGAGTRLWPLSRQQRPKFLLDLTGAGRTLLQQTYDRLAPICDGQLVITGRAHAAQVAEQLPELGPEAILAEPSPKDSMAAIALAAAVLEARHPEEDIVIGSFAADHAIAEPELFAGAVRDAVAAARADYVATIGIKPTRPATGFGYIHVGEPVESTYASAPNHSFHVRSFKEKPEAALASTYLASGEYLWNAGMFITRTAVLLGHLRELHPELEAGIREIAGAWDNGSRDRVLADVWPQLPKIAIDHAIAEPVAAQGGIAVVPGTFGWNDVGDWSSLRDLLPENTTTDDGARILGNADLASVRDSAGALVVPAGGRKVVVLGGDDLIVVDTPGAVLVARSDQSQRVKEIVDELRKRDEEDLL